MASDVQVCGTDWCGVTFRVREYLTNSNIEYEYHDIDRDPATVKVSVWRPAHALDRVECCVIAHFASWRTGHGAQTTKLPRETRGICVAP
jgi:hypothetical protein